MPFSALDGTQYSVDIYHEGYKGEIVYIKGSDNPFVVSEQADKDFLNPFVLSSGYISFIVDENITDDIFPTSAKSHFVRVETDGGKIIWSGYIKPEMYSQPWDTMPYTIELPVQCQLSVMMAEKVTFDKSAQPMQIGAILFNHIFKNLEYDYIVMPNDWATNDMFPLECKVMGYVWADDLKDIQADTIMTDLLLFWNMTLRAQGDTLYFVGHNGNTYNRYNWAQGGGLLGLADVLTADVRLLSNFEVASDDGEVQTLPPCKSITLKEKVQSSTNVGGVITENLEYDNTMSWTTPQFKDNDSVRILFYNAPNKYMKFYAYVNDWWSKNEWLTKDWNQYGITSDREANACASWVRADIYKKKDITDKKKRSYKYNDYIVLNSRAAFYYDNYSLMDLLPKMDKLANYPLATFIISDYFFAENGCLQINAGDIKMVANSWGSYPMYMMVRCGLQYWNGESWTTEKRCFKIELDKEQRIVSNKTIDMLYENADEGYLIPIHSAISGELEVTFTLQPYATWISGFSLSYCAPETKDIKKEDAEIKKEADILENAQSKIEEEMTLMSSNKTNGMNAVLTAENELPLEASIWNVDGIARTPEDAIIEHAKRELAKPRKKITASFDIEDVTPVTYIHDGGTTYMIDSIEYRLRDNEMRLGLMQTRIYED